RESGEETLCLLQKYAGKGLRAVIHSFTGDENMAKKFLTLGEDVYLGVNGIITFKKSESLRAVLKQVVPLNKIVIETDSPYLSPVPYRGRRNESAYVVEVLRKLSEIYEKTVDEVEKITNNNAKMLFFT
ncbi:MAG: TatD family hydrolase, partial [Paludibacteraceae bacterium]|nr:TatD family hydrolase [Paludibacteraceae bacterium]